MSKSPLYSPPCIYVSMMTHGILELHLAELRPVSSGSRDPLALSPRLHSTLNALATSPQDQLPPQTTFFRIFLFVFLSLNVSLLEFPYKRLILNYHTSLKSYLFQKIISLIIPN